MKKKTVSVSRNDLSRIRDNAHYLYVNTPIKEVDSQEFTAKCYLDSVVAFLQRNEIELEVVYDFSTNRSKI